MEQETIKIDLDKQETRYNKNFTFMKKENLAKYIGYKRRCIIMDCHSTDLFHDRPTNGYICMKCGYYWEVKTVKEKTDDR